MELLELELRRAEQWQQCAGVAVATVGAKLLGGEALAPREQRLALQLAGQEPALGLALSLLLNMAGDVQVEAKMVKKASAGKGGGWRGECVCCSVHVAWRRPAADAAGIPAGGAATASGHPCHCPGGRRPWRRAC